MIAGEFSLGFPSRPDSGIIRVVWGWEFPAPRLPSKFVALKSHARDLPRMSLGSRLIRLIS